MPFPHHNTGVFRMTKSSKNPGDFLANPAPLGLMGFGMTTILLNIHNAGHYGLGSMILAMGIFYGGLAQVIAGIMEYNKKNTFGVTAFTSYGLFWISLVALLVFPKVGIWDPINAKSHALAMGWYFFSWGAFTALMFIGTLKSNRILQFVFASLAVLFFLLAIKEWMVFNGVASGTVDSFTHFLGYEGILCGASAFYLAMAEVINGQLGKTILPIFPVNN